MFKASGFYFPHDVCLSLKTEKGFIWYHYFNYSLAEKETEKAFRHIRTDDGVFEKLKKRFYIAAQEVEKNGIALVQKHVRSTEFQKEYALFFESLMTLWENSLYIDLLDPFENRIIDFIFGSNKPNKHDLNILMSPDEPSYYQKYQTDLLTAVGRIRKERYSKKCIQACAVKLSKKYYWQNNDYEKVEFLGEAYFQKEIEYALKHKEEIRRIEDSMRNMRATKTRKAALIKLYKLKGKSLLYLTFFNWVTVHRDDRKKFNQISNYILVRISENVSRELGIDRELLAYALPSELPDIIKDKKSVLANLNERRKSGLAFFPKKNQKLEVLSGKIVLDYLAILEATVSASEIKGATASPGKIIGTAKIVLNQNDFAKVEKGDVIVASMTRPEYVPIMKKASAIITDEGGITCHAAIVSRELNLPCITGTQIATRALQDGDLIDVNADHGLIKIIRRANA